MSEIVFSTQRRNFEKGRHYQNPQYFDGRFPPGTKHVYVLGDWPKVIEAAEAQDINRTQLAPGAPISWRDGVAPVEPGKALVEIPDTWKHYGNPRIIELATEIAQRDVANRKQAVRIIEDELDRRAHIEGEEQTPEDADDEDPDNGELENEDVGNDEEDDQEAVKKTGRRNRRK